MNCSSPVQIECFYLFTVSLSVSSMRAHIIFMTLSIFSPFKTFINIKSNNGHMIKFELFEGQNNYQCHFKNLGTFVVSISHFMRAYFNQQALLNGNDFKLPGDAGYLNVSLHVILEYIIL